MIRLFSYLTLDVAGEPTAWASYYDLEFSDLNVDMSNNVNVVEERSGLVRMIYDPTYHYPVRGDLVISINHINERGTGATLRYLGNVLYRTYALHLPLCLFLQDGGGRGMKSYVCYLTSCDKLIAANATTAATEPMNTIRLSAQRAISFDMLITLDGVYTNIDDITSPVWNTR